jgi:gamma-glutamyltranspeptidase/glutathione hydrolase
MVATSSPLASQAGIYILRRGGNAIDAAIAAAAALAVVEPTGNGLGSDAFAIIWKDGKLRGINGSGPSPKAYDMDAFSRRGWSEIPAAGWGAVTVPGAPGTWAALSSAMGRLPLTEVLSPAVEYARDGFAVPVNVARFWGRAVKKFAHLGGEAHAGWFETFCPNGRAPEPGELFRNPDMAGALAMIGESGAESFYSGETALRIVDFSRRTGGFLTADDLSSFKPEWTEPISVNYKGYDVWEMPPNGQGIVALIALGILRDFDFSGHDDTTTIHRQIEAIKMGFADAAKYVADPRFSGAPVMELLSDEYLASRRTLIGEEAASRAAGDPRSGGTVYLCAADGDGNMISFIQSNFNGFGSGIVAPGTGVSLNNRARCFSLDPASPNALAGGKRPYNTIIPGFLTKDGEPVGPFGVMGAYMQPQGHAQVIMNCVDFGMNPQEALDAPRWQWKRGVEVSFEPGWSDAVTQKLARMGHAVETAPESFEFGRGQVIWRTPQGTLVGGTEPRADGCVAVW